MLSAVVRLVGAGAVPMAVLAVMLCSCIPVRHRMNPAYKDRSFEGRRLLIYPAPLKRVRVNCSDDINRTYRSTGVKTTETIINDAFYLGLQAYLQENANGIGIAGLGARRNALPALYDTDNAETVTLEYDEKHIDDFQVARGAFLERNGIRPDIVLYVNRIDFMKMFQQRSDPNSSGEELYISVNIRYVLWDHEEHAAVSYGEVEASEPVVEEMTPKVWLKLFEKAGKKMLYKTPFR